MSDQPVFEIDFINRMAPMWLLNNGGPLTNIDTTGVLLTLRINYEDTQTQCQDGAEDVNVNDDYMEKFKRIQ